MLAVLRRSEWRGLSPRLSAWATQLRRDIAAVACCWRHYADLTGPVIKPQTSRIDSDVGNNRADRSILVTYLIQIK